MKKILIINGPNIKYIGLREKKIYGQINIAKIDKELLEIAKNNKVKLKIFYSNFEGEIVEIIQESINIIDFIIINAGAFTHTSIAIRDALLINNMPFIEIHFSNPYTREMFRQKSYLSDIAEGVIIGLKFKSYKLALLAAIEFCIEQNKYLLK